MIAPSFARSKLYAIYLLMLLLDMLLWIQKSYYSVRFVKLYIPMLVGRSQTSFIACSILSCLTFLKLCACIGHLSDCKRHQQIKTGPFLLPATAMEVDGNMAGYKHVNILQKEIRKKSKYIFLISKKFLSTSYGVIEWISGVGIVWLAKHWNWH